eukprot:scaffold197965_cov37-Prasinocladus_malaysianus.AAC.1
MCSVLQDDLGAAINAAKDLVKQSNASVWSAQPGFENGEPPQTFDGVVELDSTSPAGELESDAFEAWQDSSSYQSSARKPKAARPASAQPWPTRARPGSGRPKPRNKSRPKSALPTSGRSHQREHSQNIASHHIPDNEAQATKDH